MTETWLLAELWLGLALVATLLSIWLRVATALSEIVVGTVAMSTGLTFGTISALFGLSHGVITRAQYSAIVAAVVASAVVPTLIANAFFLPRHLLKSSVESEPAASPMPSDVRARRVS
jgi:hypothetical protein